MQCKALQCQNPLNYKKLTIVISQDEYDTLESKVKPKMSDNTCYKSKEKKALSL